MRALLTLLCLFFLSTLTQARQTQEIERIVGNNSPDDFANFVNSAPNPNYTGDATYSITLTTVQAGGGLDFPLVLTYNSNAVRESAQSGYVGFGWDLNIGEVVRAVNHVPDEQYRNFFGVSKDFHLGGILGGDAWHAEQDGIIAGGDVVDGGQQADEWDNYNLSTPYGGANLVPSKPSVGILPFYFMEKPYQNWFIEYTRSGLNQYFSKFDLTDDLGRKYKFDYAHYARADFNGDGVKGVSDTKYYRYPTSWKLTRIDSPNSDHYVDIEYDDYAHAGSSITTAVNTPYEITDPKRAMLLAGKTLPGDIFVRTTYDESVVDYIETLTHKVEFFYIDDPTNVGTNGVKRKLLSRIEVYSKKDTQMIEKITLDYTTSVQHKATITYVFVNQLAGVNFVNPLNELDVQSYDFDYYPNVTSVVPDKFGYVAKNNLLETITVPTGGTIDYEYEERRYNFYYDLDTGGNILDQVYTTNNSAFEYLAGMRVSKITVDGKVNDNPNIVKEFSYGEGVRVDKNYESVTSNYGSTKGYSNRIMGHVGHRWVEVKDSEGGFTKTYYTSGISHPVLHFGGAGGINGRCYFDPVDMPNHCPSFINEEEAFSVIYYVNPRSQFSSREFYMNMEEAYGKVYKTETGYYTGSTPTITQSSDSKWIRLPSDQFYPQAGTSDVQDRSQTSFIYKVYDKVTTDGKQVDTYYANHSIDDDGANGNARVRFHGLYPIVTPPQSTIVVDGDSTVVTEVAYLGGKGALHNKLVNMINYKISELTSRETNAQYGGLLSTLLVQLNGDLSNDPIDYPGMATAFYSSALRYFGGYWTYWDNTDGKYRPRETWAYTESNLSRYINPCYYPGCSGTDFNIPYTNNGRLIQSFDEYDTKGNLVETSDGLGIKTSYDLSDDGMLIGAFSNADKDDIFAHSFAYEGLTNWTFVDRNSDGDTHADIEDGKLKLTNESGATNGEFDHIYYNHGSEITQDVIWEFDVKIANSNNWDLQMNAGGSSWNKYSVNSEAAVWTAINNEQWRVYNGSSWITLKTGLVVGDTYQFKIVMHPGTNKADYYLNGELLNSGVSFRQSSSGIQSVSFASYGYGSVTTEWFIDNVRLYPEEAQASSQELDYYTLKPLTVKGVGGETQRFEYDGFGRLHNYFDQNGQLVNTYNYGYSAARNNGTFTESDPNNVESITYVDPYYYHDFSNSLNWSTGGPGYTGDVDFNIAHAGASSTMRLQANQGGSATAVKATGEKSVAFKVDFYPSSAGIPSVNFGSSGHEFGVQYLASTDEFRIKYRKNSGSFQYPKTLPLDSPYNQWYTIEIEKLGSTLIAWVYPKGQGRNGANSYSLGGFDANWIPSVNMASTVSSSYADNFSLSKSVITGVSFSDGVGRNIQSQTRGGTSTVISDTRYDGRGLTVAVSKPHFKTSQYSYLQNAFEGTGSFTPSGALTSNSAIQDYWDATQSTNDANFAYSYTEYEQSMTNRVISSTLPGYSHRDGAGAESNMSYGLNTVAISTPNKTWAINTLYKTLSEDQNNKKNITYTDYQGRTVASGVDMNNDSKLTTTSTDLITTFEYDFLGNLILVTDPKGLETTYEYNAMGELLEKKLPDQDNAETYKYDDKGRVRFVEKSSHKESGSSSTISLNQTGTNITKTISPTKAGMLSFTVSVSTEYGGYTGEIKDGLNGDKLLLSDFAAVDEGWEITVDGSIAVGPGTYKFFGEEEHYWDSWESITGSYEFKPFLYSYSKYDDFDRVIEIGEYYGTTAFSSANVNTASFPTTDKQAMVEYKYDTPIAYTSARNTKGRLAEVWYYDPYNPGNSVGKSFYSYNQLGQVEWIIQRVPGLSGDKKITYTYDSAGKLLEMGYNVTNSSDDHYFWYEYDELGRLEFVYSDTDSNPAGRIKESENSSYLADGLVAQMKLGNSNVQTVDYTYTMQGWLDKVNAGSVSSATNGDRFALDLNYNLNGTIGTQIWRQSSISTSYGVQYGYSYDNANRLTLANFTDLNLNSYDDNHNGYDVTYGYDDNGNITTLTRNGQGSLYSAYPQYSLSSITIPGTSNRLTSYATQTGPTSPATQTVTYDASGNMIKNRFNNAGYDWRNRMTDVTKGSTRMTFSYDNNGKRIRKEVVGGIETHYVRGANGEAIAVYENGSRALVNLLAEGEIIGNYDGTQRRYFLKDHLGNIRTTVDQSGNVDGYDDYYPFGSVMPGRSSNTSNPDDLYKFTGHERDDEAGLDLDYMLARNYDPVIGRFVQIDPMASDFAQWSPYTYAYDNPTLYTDPNGKSPWKLLKSAYNVGKRAYKTYKKTGKINASSIGKALKSEALSIVDNAMTLVDSEASMGEKALAAFDLVTGFGDEVKAVKKMVDKADDISDTSRNISRLDTNIPDTFSDGRSGALRNAKRTNDIPMNQHPDNVIRPNTPEGNSVGLDSRNVRQYEYTNRHGEKISIREDKAVTYPDGGTQPPHFNAGKSSDGKLKQHHYF